MKKVKMECAHVFHILASGAITECIECGKDIMKAVDDCQEFMLKCQTVILEKNIKESKGK